MIRKTSQISTLLILTLLFLMSAILPAQERLAVLDTVLPEGINQQVVIPITEKIMEEFVQSKLFIVVDRSFIEKTLSEMEFSLSDLVSSEEKLSEFGGFLKATYIVVSTVQRLDTRYFISAKMIEVKTGVIIAQASADKDGSTAVLIEMAGAVGEKLVLSAMGKPTPQGGGTAPQTTPEKEQSIAQPSEPAVKKGFASFGILAGLGLAKIEVDDVSGSYDYFSLYYLELYDAEVVSSFSFGVDVRYPVYQYFYAGLIGRYSEYSYYGYNYSLAMDYEAFASFTEIAGLIGVWYPLGVFQPYAGFGLAYIAGYGEYLDDYGDVLDSCDWSGLPFGFEVGIDYQFSGKFFAGVRYSRFSGYITSDSGYYDSDYTGSGLMVRFGMVF
jgi:TolB-like protein